MDVVILAAGRGRRFGAAKQFVPLAPDGATLLEVTAADARRAGCRRLVVVTAPGREEDVQGLFAARPVAGLTVTVVLQRDDDLPAPATTTRDRPWGTAHAVWAARQVVHGPFLLFNADDHYGPNAPAVLAAALGEDGPAGRFVMLGYPLGSTLSGAGTVSRAIAATDPAGQLTALQEYPVIAADGRVAAGPDTGRLLPLDAPVSMNAWGFTPAVFPLLEAHLTRFLAEADLTRDECYLPAAIAAGVTAGEVEVQVLAAPDRWSGLTWPEDRARVARALAELAAVHAAAAGFALATSGRSPVPFGTGLVHATWHVDTAQGPRLLQRLNAEVFADPVAIAENAAAVAARLDDALATGGDDDPRHRLVFIRTADGRPWLRDTAGAVWRCLVAIPGARPADPARPAELRAAARALGRFPELVASGRGPEPAVVLPGFHDTPARLAAFRAALAADACARGAGCRDECQRLLALANLAGRLDANQLPVRPVHNDAKPDNVLVDAATGEALCVIDLDTVMPGLAAHDFGDLVRGAVTGRPEDEPDLSLVTLRRDAFADLAAGYLEGSNRWLTDTEQRHLVDGALVITYEQALRFLADHLAGDVYYRVDDAGHNLRRSRAQLRLLDQLLAAEADLRRIVDPA